MSPDNSLVWCGLLVFALILIAGIYSTPTQSQQIPTYRKEKPMTKRVEGVPLANSSLCDDFILNHVIGKNMEGKDTAAYIRNNEKYQARLLRYTINGDSRTGLYEFFDHSLLEIVEDIKSKSFAFNPKKKA